MNREDAIEHLLNCQWLNIACKSVGKKDWEDLRQLFWLEVLQIPNESFVNILDENKLRFYCVRILINLMSTQSRGKNTVHNTLRPKKLDFHEDCNKFEIELIEYDISTDNRLELKDAIINQLPMYERVIFKLHESGKSMRQISNETKICRAEINKVIKSIKTTIRDAATNI